eukprot:1260983-Pyramimonas_sp.AAC.2
MYIRYHNADYWRQRLQSRGGLRPPSSSNPAPSQGGGEGEKPDISSAEYWKQMAAADGDKVRCGWYRADADGIGPMQMV